MKKTFKTIVTGVLISSILTCGGAVRSNNLPEIKAVKIPASAVHIETLPTEVKALKLPCEDNHVTENSFYVDYHTGSDGNLIIEKIYLMNPTREEHSSNEKDATTPITASKKAEEEVVIYEDEIPENDEVGTIIEGEKIPSKKELIATFSTNYSLEEIYLTKGYNINLACKEVSVVIPNGEDFNWHKIVGNTGKDEGYKQANVFSNGKVVKGYGGGVCQVSTTIYGCVRALNLPVIERHAHGKPVYYVNWYKSEDASVDDIGGFNFIWKNNTGYDILINAYTSTIPENELKYQGLLTVEFYKLIY